MVADITEFRLNGNARRILSAIRAAGPQSRADLARALEIEPSTVTRLTAPLLAEGLLTEEPDPSRAGRKGYPSKLLAVRPDALFTAGVYIDPDRIRSCICDLAGKALAQEERPVEDRAFHAIMTEAGASIARLMRASGIAQGQMLGCGVSYPGQYSIDPTRVLRIRPFEAWPEVNVARDLSPFFGMPVRHMNDAKAACLAELHYGVARSTSNFCLIWLSYGIGGAAVLNHHLHLGTHALAAEWGGLFPKSEPRPSGQDLLDMLARAGSPLDHLSDLTPAHLARADVVAWRARSAEQLRWLCLVIARTFAPEAIVIGGTLPSELIDGFIAHVEAAETLGPDFFVTAPRILRADQDRHPELGSAVLPVHEMFSPEN